MPPRRAKLAPDQMSVEALYIEAHRCVRMCRWGSGCELHERERLLDQLDRCLYQLEMRGHQLAFFPADHGNVS